MNKFERIAELISARFSDPIELLDVGCRRQELRPYVEAFGKYKGADLFQTGDVDYVGDFTKGLPVPNRAFDVVVALDVVEHTEDMAVALDELMRVTRKVTYVILPNHAHFSYRLNFFFRAKINDKFRIRFPLDRDRHRWLTIASETDAFMRAYSLNRGFRLEILPSRIGSLGPWLERTLGQIWPDPWVRDRVYALSLLAD